jgi:hypothetical protein
MTTYYFKPKNCKDKFASLVTTATLQEAVEHFAKVKQLPIEEFEKLYEVKPKIS